MGRSSIVPLALLLAIAVIFAAVSTTALAGDSSYQLGWIPAQSECRGTIAECLAGDEFELDSESNRRILAARRYISYEALKRNSVPCSRRGASYYNCRPGGPANPYTRGCSAITRCRTS